MKTKERINIAIDGNSGAGKSTLASLIGNVYECNIFHMDDFFLTPDLKTEERLKEAGGNVDYVRFKNEVIDGINSGLEFQYHKYDCKQMLMGQPVSVTPQKLNIIEGSYSMHPNLIDNYDLKIFLHIDEKEQSSRILERNGAYMHKRFLCEWIPLENRYFEELKIQEQSDLVFHRP
jgi:uridine kinase